MNSAESATQPLIAVVDDDASFLRSMGRLLKSVGYRVRMFGSGREFLASLPDLQPECLVVDMHMPGMTGLELLEQLAAHGSSFPAILVTAFDTPQTRERARSFGSSGLLLKPFDKQVLLSTIEAAIKRQPGNLENATPPATA